MNTKTEKCNPRIVFGIILISLGGLLIASNVGVLPHGFHKIVISWQMLLIIIGIVSIVKHQIFHFHGLSMLCLGIFFIIPKVAKVFPSAFSGMDMDNFIATYWPVLPIICGIILILYIPVAHRRHVERCGERVRTHFRNTNCCQKENCSQEEHILKVCVFSSGRYIVNGEFKGGTLQAIFGGIEFDLRKACLPEGETILNIEAIFGGIELSVPDNWLIEVKVESVLGGIDDSRMTVPVDSTHRLVIKGSAVFGGVEIKN
jgi:predicted membrane protein